MEKVDSRKNSDPNRSKIMVERPGRYQRERATIHEYSRWFGSLRELMSDHKPQEGGGALGGIFGMGGKRPSPFQFGIEEMKDVTVEEMCEKFREKNGDSVKVDDFEYGDIVNFGDYRGTGFWYVGGGCHWNRKKWKLVPSWSEYGYGKPLEFYDSPFKYYEGVFSYVTQFEEYVDLDRCFGFRAIKALEDKFDMIKKNNGKYTGTTEIDYGEQTIENMDTFRELYFGVIYNDHSFDDGENNLGFVKKENVWRVDEEKDQKKEFEEAYELRIKRIRQDIWVVLCGTLHELLPWDVCLEISKFLIKQETFK